MSQMELYLRILDQFPNPIWRAGLDTKCDFFNKAWLTFTGRTMEQEMGEGWAEGVHPDDLRHCVDIYLQSFKERRHFEMEYRIKHNDGSYHWILDSGSPFFDDKGEFLGYIGSCYDINDKKTRLDELEVSDKLNKFMVERELTMVQMKARIKELEEELKKKK